MAWREKATKDTKSAQAILETSMRNQWAFSAEYKTVQKRMFEIQQGLRPGSDLVILDDEFSPASSQIWEFAMIEKVSGKVLVNTCIEHEKGIDHGAENPFLRHLSYRKAANVFSASRLPMIPRLNADQVASQLRARFLEPAGHDATLPPDENCISLLQLFRMNLKEAPPGRGCFPLALEFLFPLFYPRHHLIGLNHRALEDCLQTRLLSIAFDELCRPAAEREGGWRPENFVKTAQTSLLGWLNKPDQVDTPGKSTKRQLTEDAETPSTKKICREGF